MKFDSALAASLQHSSKAVSNPCNASNLWFIPHLPSCKRSMQNEKILLSTAAMQHLANFGCGSERNFAPKFALNPL